MLSPIIYLINFITRFGVIVIYLRGKIFGTSIYSGVYGSVGKPRASNPEVPYSTPGSSCFSLMFSKNLINDKYENTRKKMLLFVLYCPGPLTVIYNMYKSMTS